MAAEPIRLYNIGMASPRVPVRERLPFLLPYFNRQSWVSEAAQSVWEPRFGRVAYAWLQMEWLSVTAGLRECGLIWVSPSLLPTLIPMWEAARLSAAQLVVEDAGLQADTADLICIIVGSLDKIAEFRAAWEQRDHETVGRLLGYPACCRAFFREVWVEQQYIDTTWSMSENSRASVGPDAVRIALPREIPPLANILWRWAGVRAVPHLPCRFDCLHSIEFGKEMLEIGRKAGFGEEVDWISEILSWPVEYSALHGIAEVKSPVMKISTRTDATAGKCVVQWEGRSYPGEGAVGLHFPYQAPAKPMLTRSPGYQRGLANVLRSDQDQSWRYAENGFVSSAAMEELHRPIVTVARKALAGVSGNVLDLGCGNGMLLRSLCEGRPDLVPYGIDSNKEVIDRARQILPKFRENFVPGDIFDVELWETQLSNREPRQYALALLMPGRLSEVSEEKAAKLIGFLRTSCSTILAYAYPDWSGRMLQSMVRQFGLELEESDYSTVALLKAL
jgi:2-polyprenyl-3-methyl-5-hydroxy-6-metoxy-1,4-benzoquinol methylase